MSSGILTYNFSGSLPVFESSKLFKSSLKTLKESAMYQEPFPEWTPSVRTVAYTLKLQTPLKEVVK